MHRMPVTGQANGRHMGLGGGDLRDKLMIAGLVVVIAGAIFALAMSFRGGGKKGVILPKEYHIGCLVCNNEWVLSQEEYNAHQRALGEDALMRTPQFECPKCHDKRQTGFIMSRCPYPECRKYYMPGNILSQYAGQRVPDPQPCPHCGKNLMEGYRQYPEHITD